jgi:uncharacterized protein YraI
MFRTKIIIIGIAALLIISMGVTALLLGRNYFMIAEQTVSAASIPTIVAPTAVVGDLPTAAVTLEATEAGATAVPTTAATLPAATAASTTPIAVLNTSVQYVLALSDVNIRSGPSTHYNIIGWVADGQTAKVTGISSDNGWWRVICPDGSTGSCWVTAGSQYTQPTSGVSTAPTATSPATACTNSASLVSDVTIPDGTQFAPNSGFNKTWRIKNSGTCTWDTSYKLVHAGGNLLGAISAFFPLPNSVLPGHTVDLTISMVSPATANTYQSDWNLQSGNGQTFGVGRNNSAFWVKIVVATQSPATGSISGFVWQDKDNDNVVDGNELLPNIMVTLATSPECSTIIASIRADGNGRFSFTNLAANTYCLYGTDGSTTAGRSDLVLAANQQLTDIKVVWPPVWPQQTVISGLVYQDANQNGVYDNGETLMGSRQIRLIPGTACHVQQQPQATAFSDGNGRYTLAGEFNGSFCVGVANDNGLLEDVVSIAVTSGQTMNNINLKWPAAIGSISGYVWNDYCLTNKVGDALAGDCVADGNGDYHADGMVQPTESNIAGIEVLLQLGACGTDNPVAVPAVTDSTGRYSFSNLQAGTYCVSMNAASSQNAPKLLPGDWTFPARGIWYQQITLQAGANAYSVNFGWDYQLQ